PGRRGGRRRPAPLQPRLPHPAPASAPSQLWPPRGRVRPPHPPRDHPLLTCSWAGPAQRHRRYHRRAVAAGVAAPAGLWMIRPVWPGAKVAGPAFTAACAPGDNLAIHVAVTAAPHGSVLVADASAVPHLGYWGEVLTTGAQARGLAGLVIDGCVRDVDALAT